MNKRSPGFTLVELIVSVTILAFIAMFVGQAIQRALRARSKIQKDIDRSVALREAIQIMSRDIQLAFNYRDINIKLYNAAIKARCNPSQTPSGSVTPTPQGAPPATNTPTPDPSAGGGNQDPNRCKEKEEKIVTQFIGEGDKLDFTALSHVRLRKDDPASDQAEIGYQLKSCKTRLKREDGGQCLWRRVAPIIDDKVTEGGQETVLLENVKSLTFRYLDVGTDGEWEKGWSSEGKMDTVKAGKFPVAVEITLQIFDKQFNPPKELGMTVVAPLRFPNNQAKEDTNAPATQPTQ